LIASSSDSFRPNCSNLFIYYFKLAAKVGFKNYIN